jgi:serine/threonine protein phosphatase 1
MARRIIIGDVHGWYGPLADLLSWLSPGAEDRVILLGDLIDRGPESARAIALVQQQGYECLMGNHEHLMLQALEAGPHSQQIWERWRQTGGAATLESCRRRQDPLDLLPWLRTLPIHLDLGDLWLSHAGLDPSLSLGEQGVAQCCWMRDDFLTWPKPYFRDKTIVLGHTVTATVAGVQPGQLLLGPSWVDIETGLYHPASGWLTALDWDRQRVYQINRLRGDRRSLTVAEAGVRVNPRSLERQPLSSR